MPRWRVIQYTLPPVQQFRFLFLLTARRIIRDVIHHPVQIDGEAYWDGGFAGNPALFPLIYDTEASDVLLVQINPLVRPGVPTTVTDINDRVNEITFNASLVFFTMTLIGLAGFAFAAGTGAARVSVWWFFMGRLLRSKSK